MAVRGQVDLPDDHECRRCARPVHVPPLNPFFMGSITSASAPSVRSTVRSSPDCRRRRGGHGAARLHRRAAAALARDAGGCRRGVRRPVELGDRSRARPQPRVRVRRRQRRPDGLQRRCAGRALPRLRGDGRGLRQHRLPRRDRRQPGLRTPHDGTAPAAGRHGHALACAGQHHRSRHRGRDLDARRHRFRRRTRKRPRAPHDRLDRRCSRRRGRLQPKSTFPTPPGRRADTTGPSFPSSPSPSRQ